MYLNMNTLLFRLIVLFIGFYLGLCAFGCAPAAHAQMVDDQEGRLVITPDGVIQDQAAWASGAVELHLPRIEQMNLEAAKIAVKLAVHTHRALLVHFDGTGGNLGVGLAIYALLVDAPVVELRCLVEKSAQSMDAFLFQMLPCKRAMGRNAELVFHHVNVAVDKTDDASVLARKAAHEEEYTNMLCAFVSRHSDGEVPVETCHANLHLNFMRTWTVSASEALALHLADFTVKGTK